MAKVTIDDNTLLSIGNAIREKLYTQGQYKPSQMPQAIRQIGINAVIMQKSIFANGTYNVPLGVDGFNPITVNVPNTYSASDEGKVVDNGALVSQSSQNISQNGTYDTTLKNEVVVNVESSSIPSANGVSF